MNSIFDWDDGCKLVDGHKIWKTIRRPGSNYGSLLTFQKRQQMVHQWSYMCFHKLDKIPPKHSLRQSESDRYSDKPN